MSSSTVSKWCEMIVPHGPSRLITSNMRRCSSSVYTDSRIRGGATGVRILCGGAKVAIRVPWLHGRAPHNNVTLFDFLEVGGTRVIEPAAVADLLGKWWFNYDEGHF